MAETLFTDILTRLRPGYDNGGEVKKRGPKGPIKGSEKMTKVMIVIL